MKQTLRERKKNFKSVVLDNLSSTKKISKEDMCKLTGLSNRDVRKQYEEISMLYGLLTNSTEKGARLVNMSVESEPEIETEINEIQHSLNELTKRYKKIRSKKRALIACMKILEKKKAKLYCNSNNSVVV